MDLGHVAIDPVGGGFAVAGGAGGGVGRRMGVDRLRATVGGGVADQSGDWCRVAVFFGLGSGACAAFAAPFVGAACAGGRGDFVLLSSLDGAQLPGVSSG